MQQLTYEEQENFREWVDTPMSPEEKAAARLREQRKAAQEKADAQRQADDQARMSAPVDMDLIPPAVLALTGVTNDGGGPVMTTDVAAMKAAFG